MGSFIHGRYPHVEPLNQAWDHWLLLEPFTYLAGDGERIIAPAGFVTDFASVPRPLWNIFPPWDEEYRGASVIHDRLYSTREVSRLRADNIFLEAMKTSGVPLWKRWAMWSGVRVGGWAPWARRRED